MLSSLMVLFDKNGPKTTYYETYDFDGYYKKLIEQGFIRLIDCRMHQTYLGEEADGHYWVFSVLDNQGLETND